MKKVLNRNNCGSSTASFLSSVPFFNELKEGEINELAKKSQEISFSKGDIICKKNSYAHTFYIIKSGNVTEIVTDQNDFTCIAKSRNRNDYFGELGLLLDEGYVTTVVATTNTTVIGIPKEIFCEVIWENKNIIRNILKSLLRRLQNSGEKEIAFTQFNSEGRLAYMLLKLLDNNSEEAYVNITQEKLATYCGIARQTTSNIINNWKRMNIIDSTRGKIKLLDSSTLTDILLENSNVK